VTNCDELLPAAARNNWQKSDKAVGTFRNEPEMQYFPHCHIAGNEFGLTKEGGIRTLLMVEPCCSDP
jgi:hypothetical protein